MLITHLETENLWLVTVNDEVLYRGYFKPWESTALWKEITEKKWRIQASAKR